VEAEIMSHPLRIDLSTPTLPGLAHILRNKELWPSGFVWNYADNSTCAMGLTACFWHYAFDGSDFWDWTMKTFSLTDDDFCPIFFNRFDCKKFDQVSPEMVADAIYEYLKGVNI
jgi:hypothetical protein